MRPLHPENCPRCGKPTWNWYYLSKRIWIECEHCGLKESVSNTPVIGTVLGTVVGFVIVLVIYLVVRENHPIGGGYPVAYGGYPPYPPPAVPAACPVCGSPMTWYPQYSRWYCHTCGQYR